MNNPTATASGSRKRKYTRPLTESEIMELLMKSDDSSACDISSESEPDGVVEDCRPEESSSEDECVQENDSSHSEPCVLASKSAPIGHDATAESEDLLSVIDVPDKLFGKNKYKWCGKKPKHIRCPARNKVLHLPGNKGAARNSTSGIEVWNLFFTEEILTNIVKHTNAEIRAQRAKYSSDRYQNNIDDVDGDATEAPVRPSFTRDTNVTELKALFGLYYLAGVLKMKSLTTRELFDKCTGVIYFHSTMSQARFEFLTNTLRFDDRESRSERRKNDRLAAIREIFDHVVTTSQKLYVPSEYCTVDEQLLGFHGRCVFKMFIPSKPDKYGIKILMMCDAKTFYMLNAQVYTGKDSTPKGIPVAQYYSTEMTKPIHGTNRNCTFDNWFTSIPMAKHLLSDHSVTVVGTMKSNKPEIPPLFKDTRGRQRNSAMFAFSGEETLLSYCPPKKKKKIVTMLSTMHDQKDEDKTVRIPEIIEFYNSTKGGVDCFDKLCHTYSVSRKTRRWPLCIFYGLLNAVGINSMILLAGSESKSKESVPNRRTFLKKLATDLIRPHLEARIKIPSLSRNLRTDIAGILGIPVQETLPVQKNIHSGRCSFCNRSKDRKSRTSCNTCKKFICADHQIKICPGCATEGC